MARQDNQWTIHPSVATRRSLSQWEWFNELSRTLSLDHITHITRGGLSALFHLLDCSTIRVPTERNLLFSTLLCDFITPLSHSFSTHRPSHMWSGHGGAHSALVQCYLRRRRGTAASRVQELAICINIRGSDWNYNPLCSPIFTRLAAKIANLPQWVARRPLPTPPTPLLLLPSQVDHITKTATATTVSGDNHVEVFLSLFSATARMMIVSSSFSVITDYYWSPTIIIVFYFIQEAAILLAHLAWISELSQSLST